MKRHEVVAKLLTDMLDAIDAIGLIVTGSTFETYSKSLSLPSAVERKLEIIGEALYQALKIEKKLRGQISDARRIISVRNRLAHAYSDIDSEIIWGIVVNDLPKLRQEVKLALNNFASADGSGDSP